MTICLCHLQVLQAVLGFLRCASDGTLSVSFHCSPWKNWYCCKHNWFFHLAIGVCPWWFHCCKRLGIFISFSLSSSEFYCTKSKLVSWLLPIMTKLFSTLYVDDIKPFMIWGYYVSPMMYGQNAIAMNEFLDQRWSDVSLRKHKKSLKTF